MHKKWKHIHTIHTHTYHICIDPPFICVCMLYVLQKYTYTYITHTYQIPWHTCKILHVSACMACICLYMPVSACMNLNMHVASSNKWIVPKFPALRDWEAADLDGQGCARAEQYTQLDLESRFHSGANPCATPTWISQAVPYMTRTVTTAGWLGGPWDRTRSSSRSSAE